MHEESVNGYGPLTAFLTSDQSSSRSLVRVVEYPAEVLLFGDIALDVAVGAYARQV